MRTPFIITLLTLPAVALASADVPGGAELSASDRKRLYREHGMDYARELYLNLDGSKEDEIRSRKTEALNHRIRERGIARLENHLLTATDPRIRQELLHRLSQLYEQQGEIITRRMDLKDKETKYHSALRAAIRHLEQMRKEFPAFAPDATLFSLAENHGKLKDLAKAEAFYREVITKFPKSAVVADSLLSLGNLYFDRQAFLTARGFYERILSTEEQKLHPYAHYKVAWSYFNEHNFTAAVQRLELAILESRKPQQNGERRLSVEDEALTDLVLFFAEYGNPEEAKGFFERLVDREKANELRYMLARRLFEHGKHETAKEVAKNLLDEKPQKEFVNRLYLILISVAERTKDRDFGLQTAQSLAKWLKSEELPESDTSRVESEEYMRLYSQKLHHEAETLKKSEVWSQARKSYEIYLDTFPEEVETPEVKFRYAVLLLNRKEQLKAYQAVTEAVAKMSPDHPRFKEALKVRIQSIELATKDEREQIDDRDLLGAYDAYATNFPEEELAVEARFKAANLAKTLETPEQAAGRFRSLAEAHPEHKLARASVSEALAVLVKAQKWEALGAESRALSEKTEIQSSLLENDQEMKQRIAEAKELSLVKITEGLESEGKLEEAKAQYRKILADKPSETMGIYSYVRLAALSEHKLNKNREAITYYERLRTDYPASKEARQASLELARLYEKVNEPREAVRRYLDFAGSGNGKIELQALTNAAVVLESLGERELAADVFFRLSEATKSAKAPANDVIAALEAGCNNILLGSHQNREKRILQKIHDCARQLSQAGRQPVLWQARAAWALDQAADNLQAEDRWRRLASRSIRATPEAERAYVALAKLKMLERSLEGFRGVRFTRTNERPEANIGRKTAGLEEIERLAEAVIKIGTPNQILSAKNVIRLAYLEFAETMESAAQPSRLSDAEKEELKLSFQAFAKDFRDKAAALEVSQAQRSPASEDGGPAAAPELKFSALSKEENSWLENGDIPEGKGAELFAKKAYSLFRDGKFGDARYFTEKWKRQTASVESGKPYGTPDLERFKQMLAEKLPDLDPVTREF
jgi:cellulose synthase operon protein C